jgi:NDP-sugar pyrophosphorylase family protein
MKAVILAGGKGTRLAPYTTVFPKPMLPIDDRPILEIVIHQLANYGFKEIILSVGYLAELIQAYFQNPQKIPEGVSVTYIREDQPLGTAGSLSLIPDISETFLLMNGDVLTTLNYRKFLEFHTMNQGIMTIAMHKRQVNIDYGVLSTNSNGKLISYDEKPTLDYLVSMGIYMFEPTVLKYIEPNKKLDIPDLVRGLLAKGEPVQGYSFSDYWLDIGMHDHYEEAVRSFEKMKKKLLKQS